MRSVGASILVLVLALCATTAAGLFCIPPNASVVDSSRGLPGLGRVTTTVTARLVEP
jgi:hypothetical protein